MFGYVWAFARSEVHWPGGAKYVLGVAADAGGTLCVGMPGKTMTP